MLQRSKIKEKGEVTRRQVGLKIAMKIYVCS